MKCYLCGSTSRKRKVLKCLHTVCVKCVPQQTSFKGEVVCPACTKRTASQSGVDPLKSLPDCYVESEDNVPHSAGREHVESRVAEEKLCDECGEDTPAVAQCTDCNATLCNAHATAHPLSRATLKHRIQELTSQSVVSASPVDQPAHPCLVHTNKLVQSFCTQCNELLCEVCDYAHTSDHKQSLLPIAEAAVKAKAAIRAQLGQDASATPNALEEKLDSMTTAVDNLQSEVLNTSDKVTQYFDSIREAVSKREKDVLAQIDHHQTMRMLPIDKQRGLIETILCISTAVAAFLEAEQPDSNFLRMSAWLKEAADQQAAGLKNIAGPPQPAIFSFIPDKDSDIRAILNTVGRVSDMTLDALTSNLVCPSTSETNTEMAIQVNAKNMEGETITAEDAEKSQLLVEVAAPDNDIIPQYMLTSSSGDPSLVARHRPMAAGQYKVSATVSGKHLRGSPCDVVVHQKATHGDTFDPAKCHEFLVLSRNNLTVENASKEYGCVLGTGRYTTGRHDININLEEVHWGTCAMIGFTNNEDPPLNWQIHNPGLTAWHCGNTYYYSSESGVWNRTTDVGQPWQSGDVISFHLDCDRHTVLLTHQRSGKSHTATNVTGTQRLYVFLHHKKERLTICE